MPARIEQFLQHRLAELLGDRLRGLRHAADVVEFAPLALDDDEQMRVLVGDVDELARDPGRHGDEVEGLEHGALLTLVAPADLPLAGERHEGLVCPPVDMEAGAVAGRACCDAQAKDTRITAHHCWFGRELTTETLGRHHIERAFRGDHLHHFLRDAEPLGVAILGGDELLEPRDARFHFRLGRRLRLDWHGVLPWW